MITSVNPTAAQNLVHIRPWGHLCKWVKYNKNFCYLFIDFFGNTSTSQTPQLIWMCDGSSDTVVLFGDLVVTAPHLWVKSPKKHFGALIPVRTFKPNQCKLNKSSAVVEIGDCGHNRHEPKRGQGAAVPLSRRAGSCLIQCGLSRGLFLYQVASSSIQPFGHNRHEPKTGSCAPFRGELRPHLTQRRLGRHLPPYQVAS